MSFKYEPFFCNGFHGLMQKVSSFKDVPIVPVKGSDYGIHVWYMSKDDAKEVIIEFIFGI